MKPFFHFIAYSIIMLSGNASAQPQTLPWGSPVFGAQMSVAMSNTVMLTGSTLRMHCSITNASTNAIMIQMSSGNVNDYYVVLVNDEGKIYDLSPELSPKVAISLTTMGIAPGKMYEYDISKTLDTAVPSGNYKLKVWRWFSVGVNGKLVANHQHKVESNIVQVQLK